MAKVEREVGNSCLRGVFLDELDPQKGHKQKIVMPDCGNFCDIEFEELDHPQLDMMLETPELMRGI